MGDAIDGRAALRDLLDTTAAVLFDFDGPVCDLFGGSTTADVANRVKNAARRYWGPLVPEVESCDDSHDILRRLRDMYEWSVPGPRDPAPLALAEGMVAAVESEAALTAAPAPHIAELLDVLTELDIRLVIVSNNAEHPVREYLDRSGPGFASKFEAVFGRDPDDARRMKPDPDCVHRALKHLALPAASCLLVGDQLTDLKAARSAGTCFLGYTRHMSRAREMKQGGADHVVSSHLAVIEAAERLLAHR